MFTGIIEEIGCIKEKKESCGFLSLLINTDSIYKKLNLGDSVSVNGVCLTVKAITGNCLSFDVMEETLKKTNLGMLSIKDFVNLETALKAQDMLSGHFVTGHIDTTVKIAGIASDRTSIELILEDEFRSFVVEKGSVALDGISLTIGSVTKNGFIVYLIPFSLGHTNLKYMKKNSFLNLECDILAKYVQNAFQNKSKSTISGSFLKEHGFI
ncbi:MAG: riboflavin synthase [Candidatus Gygaella obscura]|nr:riboflavin synthase [Candidatus Gygaella obscura]